MKLLAKIGRIFDNTNNYLGVIVAALILFCMLAVSGEVFLRYFFNITTAWVLEVTEFALLFMAFLGAAWVLKREKHVSMDAVTTRLKPRAQLWLTIITSILSAILCFVITWYGVVVAWEHFQTGYMIISGLRVPSAPIMAAIPIGSFLFAVQFLRRAYNKIQNLSLDNKS